MKNIIENDFKHHIKVAENCKTIMVNEIIKAATLCINSLVNDGKIIIFGNGGSASDAQHIAAELVGRYKNERKGLAALAITTDTSILTCISNDYGYEKVFSRQIEALAKEGDVAIGISTGGTSINVINALKLSKEMGCKTIGLSGRNGGKFGLYCDVNLVVPDEDTARIQEMHIMIGHTLCNLIDKEFSTKQDL
jgi:D-sedoheptulose 7-phosphate isomerase